MIELGADILTIQDSIEVLLGSYHEWAGGHGVSCKWYGSIRSRHNKVLRAINQGWASTLGGLVYGSGLQVSSGAR